MQSKTHCIIPEYTCIESKFFRIFSQNFGGYNERTLRKLEAKEAPKVSIIDYSSEILKKRAKDWITKIKAINKADVILVSAMADATEVPPMGEFSHRYKVWVGGIHPDHCI